MLLTEMSAYSNAVQQYGKDAADFWSQYDFSPTKRYVKKMCDLFYKDKIPQNEITKIFRGYQENAEWFDEMGVDFNKLTWEQLNELVLKQTGEYDNVSQLPNQFYVSDDGLITIGYFNTFEEAMNFEPQNGWCTSVNQGRFEEHHDINHEMLYIIRNNKLSKGSNCRFVVAQVNLDGSIVYWDQKNNNLNDGGGHISSSEYETSLGDAKNKLQPMKSNNQLNCNLNMNKKLIRLTESDLHRIVKESVNKILNEIGDTPKGQHTLGRLNARQQNQEGGEGKWKETIKYARNQRKGKSKAEQSNLRKQFANGTHHIPFKESRITETSSFDMMKYERMSEYRQIDPMNLSDSELQHAIDYMFAYRWALEGEEQVLSDYIEEAKRRGLEG